MPSSPLISAVIPTYNRAGMLPEAIESVLAQTYSRREILVIDDGSTDTTGEVLARYRNDIRSVRLERSGISIARNTGIELARGEFIAFLDSDDRWLAPKLERQLQFARMHPQSALTYTDAVQFNEQAVEQKTFAGYFPALRHPDNLFETMIAQFAIPLTSSVMVETAFLRRSGLHFPPAISIGEDLGLFLRMIAAGARLAYLDECLTERRMHSSNISSNHCRRFEQRKLLYTELLADAPSRYTEPQRIALRAGLRDARYRIGECLWEKLEMKSARREFLAGIALNSQGMHSAAYGVLSLLPPGMIRLLRDRKSRRS